MRRGLLALLRGEIPETDAEPGALQPILDRHECGGYLHAEWIRRGAATRLPPGWGEGLRRAHRKTTVDTLAALAEFRRAGGHLTAEKIPFIVLKGGAYLIELYPDAGARRLTDVDLLVRRADAGRLARRLAREGYLGEVSPEYPEDRRFEMWFPVEAPCHIEFHWALERAARARVDVAALWEQSAPALLEGVFCRRLAREDAIVYHVLHAADHYFGPSLKWTIDLREMLRQWRPEPEPLLKKAAAWRGRTALHLALLALDKLFPGEAPAALLEGTRPGAVRRTLLERYTAADPLLLLAAGSGSSHRYPLRCLMLDRPADAARVAALFLARPAVRLARRAFLQPPWEWRD
ncbi:MAG: nucleotidyltransferase family protein [Candidatus Polarisedimenticolia bacterium]